MRGTCVRPMDLLYNADTFYGSRRQGWAELLEFCLGNRRTGKGRSVGGLC